jgi:hypothetical protein
MQRNHDLQLTAEISFKDAPFNILVAVAGATRLDLGAPENSPAFSTRVLRLGSGCATIFALCEYATCAGDFGDGILVPIPWGPRLRPLAAEGGTMPDPCARVLVWESVISCKPCCDCDMMDAVEEENCGRRVEGGRRPEGRLICCGSASLTPILCMCACVCACARAHHAGRMGVAYRVLCVHFGAIPVADGELVSSGSQEQGSGGRRQLGESVKRRVGR